MKRALPGFLVGLLFGIGLTLSDMINPARVLAFLDVTGRWDPTLLYVMVGAIIPSAVGYGISRRMRRPVLGREFRVPENRVVDPQLLAGAAIFGIGWGLVGFCPGPAFAALGFALWQPWVFVMAMLAGMVLFRLFDDWVLNPPAGEE